MLLVHRPAHNLEGVDEIDNQISQETLRNRGKSILETLDLLCTRARRVLQRKSTARYRFCWGHNPSGDVERMKVELDPSAVLVGPFVLGSTKECPMGVDCVVTLEGSRCPGAACKL